MKAIKTTFLGPTNTQPSRCKATDEDGNSVVRTWDSELSPDENHRKAAYALRDKMDWARHGELITGGLKDCYVHVFVGRAEK